MKKQLKGARKAPSDFEDRIKALEDVLPRRADMAVERLDLLEQQVSSLMGKPNKAKPNKVLKIIQNPDGPGYGGCPFLADKYWCSIGHGQKTSRARFYPDVAPDWCPLRASDVVVSSGKKGNTRKKAKANG